VNALIADFVLAIHLAFVVFVTGGLALIWIGACAGWNWVRNLPFRIIHLAAIVVVAAESASGIWCPLTVWEDTLRGTHSDMDFIARGIHRVLFYDFPTWVFTAAYIAFAAVVVATWWLVRPEPRR